MRQLGFRGRLFAVLLAFALVPAVVLSLGWGAASWWAFPLVGSPAAWDTAAATGQRAITAVRGAPLTDSQRIALAAHEETLARSLLHARQAQFVYRRAGGALLLAGIIALAAVAVIASRVAGSLSRSLSRPVQELVGWTEAIARGAPIPEGPPRRGAPEFATLRSGMRAMAEQLERARARELEAERASALRESARQFAHELKNPLTPIRFAVSRLQRDVPQELAETVEVLATESLRLEEMARSFAQFGRLPEGPTAAVDLGELARYTARAAVPPELTVDVEVEDGAPMVAGHHDALSRALSNVMLNAVEACRTGGSLRVTVRRATLGGRDAAEIEVADTGCGMTHEQLRRIWEPYVTYRPGGTGLGLAIVRQTVDAHGGSVSASSTPGAGTTVRLTLPITRDGAEPSVSNAREDAWTRTS